MGVLLVSMSADAFILLMPTGGVPPSCFTAPAADGSSSFVAPFTLGAATLSAPFSLCP
jgi:hypothetical protein